MISEKRSQAARANGARSRGPVTPEGKAISARNATRHGLLSQSVVLKNEDEKTFEALFYLLIERFSPVDDIEMSAIEEMASAHWRMRRVMAMERAILDAGILKHLGIDPAAQTAAVFCDPATQATLALLQRYEARFQNMYNRALRSLAALRKLPRQTPPDPPEESEADQPGPLEVVAIDDPIDDPIEAPIELPIEPKLAVIPQSGRPIIVRFDLSGRPILS
jgi:hypothetical protein